MNHNTRIKLKLQNKPSLHAPPLKNQRKTIEDASKAETKSLETLNRLIRINQGLIFNFF